MTAKKQVTLKDIAAQAGCSFTAVSKVLNKAKGSAGVSEEMARRIREIAGEMGYRSNYHAAALKRGRSRSLGLLLGWHLNTNFYGQLIEGINEVARNAGENLLILGGSSPDDSVAEGKRALQEI